MRPALGRMWRGRPIGARDFWGRRGGAYANGRAARAWRVARERTAQGTLEYALTVVALLAMVVACAAIWRAAVDGTFAGIVQQAASHLLDGDGFIDISLY